MGSRRLWRAVARAGSIITALALGAIVQRAGIPAQAKTNATEAWSAFSRTWKQSPEPDLRDVSRRKIVTNLFDIDEYTIDTGQTSVAIEQFEHGLIFVEGEGQLGYLSFDGVIRYLGHRVPMNVDGLYQWLDSSEHPLFLHRFRALDALLVEEPSGGRTLYISHHRFAEDCVQLVISAVSVAVGEDGPVFSPGGWRQVFVAKPCVALPPKALNFSGHESGGRMVQLAPHRLLVTIGHFGYEGVYMAPAVSMDSNVDLGKIIDLNPETGESQIFTLGHRNPQGLTIDSLGRIWSSEHGPYGGDELNLILHGRNYGWPLTTFGTNYGLPRADWPSNARQGRHDGAYEMPKFSFSRSPGLSNLVEISGEEFPLWRGDLLLGSMIGQTLFRLRLHGTNVISEERIAMNERIRDLIRLEGGSIAISTDSGKIKILQRVRAPAEAGSAPLPANVSGFAAVAEARARDALGKRQMTEAEVGRRLFGAHCSSCHTLDGSPSSGPSLRGVVGRRIASVAGYAYSEALRQAEGTWTNAQLYHYIADTQKAFPGTTMSPPQIHNRYIDEVIAFLEDH